MKRFMAFLTATVLFLACMMTSAGALRKNAVISVFLSNEGERNRWSESESGVYCYVNGCRFSVGVNDPCGEVLEIYMNGWISEMRYRDPVHPFNSPGVRILYSFGQMLEDLGLIRDPDFPEGSSPLTPTDLVSLLKGPVGGDRLRFMQESWSMIHSREGMFAATNIGTGTYVQIELYDNGSFQIYVALPSDEGNALRPSDACRG